MAYENLLFLPSLCFPKVMASCRAIGDRLQSASGIVQEVDSWESASKCFVGHVQIPQTSGVLQRLHSRILEHDFAAPSLASPVILQ